MGSSSEISALDRIRLFLRPPGKGLYTQSTGGGYAQMLLKTIYGTDSAKDVHDAWEEGLQKIRRVEAVLLGVPSDTGAGILRGANFGPIGVREAYLAKYGPFPKHVLDIGDVICIPQLLHDEMLSNSQIQASREALYGKPLELPVSPLSITEGVLSALMELNRQARFYLIGGDHSISWPAMVSCHQRFAGDFGVLHFDAHTDLLESRLGVKYCFGTWASHATRLMKPQHLVQIGIRTSARDKAHWTQTYPLHQIWAKEVFGHEQEVIESVLGHFTEKGVKHLYISNDIDGTDSGEAPATGTPEANGLHAEFVETLIAAVKKEFSVIGGDIVEVAPPLSGLRDFANEKTCLLAADYLKTMF